MQEDESITPGPDKDPEAANSNPRTQTEESVRGGLDTKAKTEYSLGGSHVFYRTQYGSDELPGMKTKVSRVRGTQEDKQQTIQALADSGASTPIISWDLAETINMTIYEKGEATLKDGSHNHMDVSGIGAIMVQEDDGLPLKIKVLVSRSLGKEELVVGLSDLKDLNILHKDFPRTLPEFRRSAKFSKPSQYNTMRGDQWFEQEVREERQRARGVLLYLEERYKQVDEKITGFDSFPEEIKVILDKYIDVFDTKLRKSMNVEPVQLNVKEGSKPYACFSCRPTPAHYRETGEKLVQDLLDQRIIQRCGASRSEYCAPAHFVEKPGRVPLALRLVVDFTKLNDQLICDQP